MVPDCHRRVQAAYADLKTVMVSAVLTLDSAFYISAQDDTSVCVCVCVRAT